MDPRSAEFSKLIRSERAVEFGPPRGTPLTQVEKIEDELRSVFAAAVSLAERATTLVRRRNLAVPVNRMPLEVFLDILQIALPPTDYSSTKWLFDMGELNGSYYARLYDFRLVSAHWRDVIDRSPPLWTTFDSRYPPHVLDVAATRSKTALVDIIVLPGCVRRHVSWTGQDPEADIRRFTRLDLVPRCRTLHVQYADFISTQLDALKDIEAPRLESLYLENDSGWTRVPFNFFKGESPKLRDLTIQGTALNWDSAGYSSLTSLILLRGTPITWCHLMLVLKRCLTLRELSLSGIDISDREHTDNHTSLPALIHLRSLTLAGAPSLATACLLEVLNAPDCSVYTLSVCDPPIPRAHTLRFFRSNQMATALRCSLTKFGHISIRIKHEEWSWHYITVGDLTISTAHMSARVVLFDYLHGVILSTDVPVSISLELSHSFADLTTQDRLDALHRFDGLVDLMLEDQKDGVDQVITALAEPLQDDNGRPKWLCPRLHTICFNFCVYSVGKLLALAENRSKASRGEWEEEPITRPAPFKAFRLWGLCDMTLPTWHRIKLAVGNAAAEWDGEAGQSDSHFSIHVRESVTR